MEYLVPILTSVVSGVLVFLLQSVIKENRDLKKKKDEADADEQKAVKEGVLCLLRSQLIVYHEKYTRNESITPHGLESWQHMYKAYKSLGGNGLVDHLKEEIDELHIA